MAEKDGKRGQSIAPPAPPTEGKADRQPTEPPKDKVDRQPPSVIPRELKAWIRRHPLLVGLIRLLVISVLLALGQLGVAGHLMRGDNCRAAEEMMKEWCPSPAEDEPEDLISG